MRWLMCHHRGGVVADILIAIGAIVVFAAIIGAGCGACASGASPLKGQSAPAVHRDRDRDCDPQQENCDGDDDHYRNVSPGPFEKSPVDVHDNDICVSLNCAGYGSTTTTTRGGAGAS